MKLILGAFLIDLSIGNLLFKKRNDQTFLSKGKKGSKGVASNHQAISLEKSNIQIKVMSLRKRAC